MWDRQLELERMKAHTISFFSVEQSTHTQTSTRNKSIPNWIEPSFQSLQDFYPDTICKHAAILFLSISIHHFSVIVVSSTITDRTIIIYFFKQWNLFRSNLSRLMIYAGRFNWDLVTSPTKNRSSLFNYNICSLCQRVSLSQSSVHISQIRIVLELAAKVSSSNNCFHSQVFVVYSLYSSLPLFDEKVWWNWTFLSVFVAQEFVQCQIQANDT